MQIQKHYPTPVRPAVRGMGAAEKQRERLDRINRIYRVFSFILNAKIVPILRPLHNLPKNVIWEMEI